MKTLAIVYHSAHGHTAHMAQRIAEGARRRPDTRVELVTAEAAAANPESLLAFDGLIFGSPTYLGGVSGPFKAFMDTTGRLWRGLRFRDKLAAGFTVSSLPAGDKQSTLMAMFVFAMQHGMQWVGNPIIPEQHSGVPYEDAANRLGSWSGLMAQAGHASPPDAFAPGDVKTAQLFGENFARALHRLAQEALA
ncbi:MAG: flavodoxin family protein [Ramlibacter sp.]|nr:flavodoxin family protein [Ramlibacter sp.]MCW5652013.1 flavodoxin family protein [Ramlibacter sp.]